MREYFFTAFALVAQVEIKRERVEKLELLVILEQVFLLDEVPRVGPLGRNAQAGRVACSVSAVQAQPASRIARRASNTL